MAVLPPEIPKSNYNQIIIRIIDQIHHSGRGGRRESINSIPSISWVKEERTRYVGRVNVNRTAVVVQYLRTEVVYQVL